MIKNINWENFKKYIAELIRFKSKTTFTPINAESWEELIYVALVCMEYGDKVEWKLGSHEKGVDLKVKLNGKVISISAKATKVKKTRGKEYISISSYRLTRYRTLDEMLNFLNEESRKLDFYLLCIREEKGKNLIYKVLKVAPKDIFPSPFLMPQNWEQYTGGWKTKDNLSKQWGLSANIVRKMSNQLWITIPLNLINLKQLTSVEVPKEELGVMLFAWINKIQKEENIS